jgi:hypothetical protein
LGERLELVPQQQWQQQVGAAQNHIRGILDRYCIASTAAQFDDAAHAAVSRFTGVRRADVQQQQGGAAAAQPVPIYPAQQQPQFQFQQSQQPLPLLAAAAPVAPPQPVQQPVTAPPLLAHELQQQQFPLFTPEEIAAIRRFQQLQATAAQQAQGGDGQQAPGGGAQQSGGGGL